VRLGVSLGLARRRRRAPWSPLDLGPKLYAWWDPYTPGSFALGAGDVVNSWTDRVGGIVAVQATAASKPVFSATGLNGRPCIVLDGVDDHLQSAALPAFLAGASGAEISAGVSQDALPADATNRVLFAVGTTNNTVRQLRRSVASGSNRCGVVVGSGAAASTSTTGATAPLDGRKVMRGVITPTQATAYVGPSAAAAAAVVPATAGDMLRIGASSGSLGAYWSGKLGPLLITALLDAGEQANLNSYIAGRIGS
jgi:hypothetical protein